MHNDAEKLLAEVLLSQKALMAEVQALRAQLEGHPGTGQGWMRSADAAGALKSEGVLSTQHLRKLMNAGAFSESKSEIRNVSTGCRPTWEYNIPTCRKALQRYFRAIKKAVF